MDLKSSVECKVRLSQVHLKRIRRKKIWFLTGHCVFLSLLSLTFSQRKNLLPDKTLKLSTNQHRKKKKLWSVNVSLRDTSFMFIYSHTLLHSIPLFKMKYLSVVRKRNKSRNDKKITGIIILCAIFVFNIIIRIFQ